jgi:hypothetical protein
VPRQCSTAGRQRLGGISRAGDERLQQLLVLGAPPSSNMPTRGSSPRANGPPAGRPPPRGSRACSPASPESSPPWPWPTSLPRRRRGTARIVWAMMTSAESCRPPEPERTVQGSRKMPIGRSERQAPHKEAGHTIATAPDHILPLTPCTKEAVHTPSYTAKEKRRFAAGLRTGCRR